MKLRGLFHQKSARIALAWLLPLAAAFVQWLIWPALAPWPWFLFFPAVIAAALIGDVPGGVGATLISVLLVTVFFLPKPHFDQADQELGNVLGPPIFLAMGVGFSLLFQRLRRSEERYHALFAGAGEGIIVIGKDGRFVDANEAYCAIVGRTREAILGRSPEALGVELAPMINETVVQTLKAQGKATFDFRQPRPDGSFVTVEVTATILRGGQVVAVVRDREEQRRMEMALRQSEAKFVKLFDGSPVPLIVSRLDNRHMVDVNTALVTHFGYSRDELIGRSTVDLSIIAPDARAALFERLQREGRLVDAELQVTCKDGTTRDCLGYADIIELPGGPHLLISLIDITERKQAERQLRDSEERFRLVVENSPSSIFLWDEEGTIRYASPAFETMLGWPREIITGQTALQVQFRARAAAELDDPAPAERRAESLAEDVGMDVGYVRAWLRALEAVKHCSTHPGEKVQVEEQIPHMAGDERSMVLTFQGFRSSSAGSEVVTVAHDITAHVALERLLAQTNAVLEEQVAERTVALAASVTRLEETLAELRRANRGKDAFMAAVSHELRTPLTAILSMADLLETQRRGPLTPDQGRYVTTIANSGRRLLATVNNIVLYTQLMAGAEPLEPARCRLAFACDQAVRMVQDAAAARQLHITQTVVPPELEIVTDVRGLINILHMLLDNAVKFTPPGGAIVVEVAEVPGHVPGQMSAHGAWAGAGEEGGVSLTVADTGVGMSPAEIEGIFTAFMQSDLTLARRFDGLGLGLAYVREMAARLGGTVTVESEVGRGSRFAVLLPLAFPEG